MKKMITLVCVVMFVFLSTGGISFAENFLSAPIMPGGTTVRSDKKVLEKAYTLPKEQVLNYYKEIFKDSKDVKFRERGSRFDIDEYGNQPWQKITISVSDKGQTIVAIEKDSWTWILGTLTIRFVGVFVVLVVLYGTMWASTSLIMQAEKAPTKKGVLAKPAQVT
jgi:uncharacterized membrane protein (DUF485 family)